MADMENIVIGAAAIVVISCAALLRNKKKRTKRWWVSSLARNRKIYSTTEILVNVLKEPPGKFESFCRMTMEDFEYILCKIGPRISKINTNWRKAIPANERLALTLRFLATGDSFISLHYLFKISPQLIGKIVHEVCTAIYEALNDVIQLPSNADEWKQVAQAFENVSNFPHCIGCLDGKHIVIHSPLSIGSEFYHNKQNVSIVLMGLVDVNYCFMFAECIYQEGLSEDDVLRNTEFFKKIEKKQLNLPMNTPLLGRKKPVPYLFISNDAFEQNKHLLKFYSGCHEKGSISSIFNYRLSHPWRIVENTFGQMSSVFRVLRKPMLLQPHKISLVTMACVVLHNFLRKSENSRSNYTPEGTFDYEEKGNIIPGSWRTNDDNMTSFMPLQKPPEQLNMATDEIRNEFGEYFATSGKVEWQDNYC